MVFNGNMELNIVFKIMTNKEIKKVKGDTVSSYFNGSFTCSICGDTHSDYSYFLNRICPNQPSRTLVK